MATTQVRTLVSKDGTRKVPPAAPNMAGERTLGYFAAANARMDEQRRTNGKVYRKGPLVDRRITTAPVPSNNPSAERKVSSQAQANIDRAKRLGVTL